jgi:hypothetical protein
LKNAKITLNTEGTLGWGINKVIVSKIGKGPTDDGFSDAVDQLLSRQSQSIALECPNGKTCCNKKSYDGEYPVSMKFRFELGRDFFGLKKTVVTGTITGRAVINGEIGECK